jgi:vancomycin permeability regulator SanA
VTDGCTQPVVVVGLRVRALAVRVRKSSEHIRSLLLQADHQVERRDAHSSMRRPLHSKGIAQIWLAGE